MKWAAILVATMVAVLAVALTFSDSARLTVGLLLSPLFDPGPPPVLGDIKCNGSNNCSAKFDALLRRQFPLGSSAKKLESTFVSQGFHHLSPPIKNCTMPGAAPVGVEVIDCPKWDSNWNPRNYLDYRWGSGSCGSTLDVLWSSDSKGRIVHLEGGYNYACL